MPPGGSGTEVLKLSSPPWGASGFLKACWRDGHHVMGWKAEGGFQGQRRAAEMQGAVS